MYQIRAHPYHLFNRNYFLKALSPVIVTLKVRASTQEWGGDIVQSTAAIQPESDVRGEWKAAIS